MTTAPARARADHLTSTAREPRAAVFSGTITRCADASADASVRLLEVRVDAPSSEDAPASQPQAASGDSASGFNYSAGQWCDFAAPGVATVGGYSFVSAPRVSPLAARAARAMLPASSTAASPSVTLAVRRSAHAPAAWVHAAAAPGARVQLRAGGRFTPTECGLLAAAQAPGPAAPLPPPREGLRHVVLVAGGVGINPLCSILLALSQWYTGDAAVAAPPALSLLYAARSVESAALLTPLLALARSGAYRPSSSSSSGGDAAPSLLSLQLFLSRQAAPSSGGGGGGSGDGGGGGNSAQAAPSSGGGGGSGDAGGGGDGAQWVWGRRLTAIDIAAELDRVRRRRDASAGVDATAASGGSCGGVASARRARDASGETVAAELAAARAGVAVLVCGPPAMTDDVIRACVSELALAARQVHTERWW